MGVLLSVNGTYADSYALHYRSKWLSHAFLVLLDFVSRATVPGVRNSGIPENTAWDQAKFYGKPPIRHISKLFFFFVVFCFSIFQIFYLSFFFLFPHMGPYGSKNFKRLFVLQFSSNLSQRFMINKVVTVEYKVINVLAI